MKILRISFTFPFDFPFSYQIHFLSLTLKNESRDMLNDVNGFFIAQGSIDFQINRNNNNNKKRKRIMDRAADVLLITFLF